MEQRISLITLGARDMDALARFYGSLGWKRAESPEGIAAFDLLGQTLGIYPLERLADDLGLPVDALGHGAATYAYNVRSADEVAPLLAQAEASGARILKPADKVFWGGYVGYFADPEGHVWEIAHNPMAPLSADGAFRWNGYDT